MEKNIELRAETGNKIKTFRFVFTYINFKSYIERDEFDYATRMLLGTKFTDHQIAKIRIVDDEIGLEDMSIAPILRKEKKPIQMPPHLRYLCQRGQKRDLTNFALLHWYNYNQAQRVAEQPMLSFEHTAQPLVHRMEEEWAQVD